MIFVLCGLLNFLPLLKHVSNRFLVVQYLHRSGWQDSSATSIRMTYSPEIAACSSFLIHWPMKLPGGSVRKEMIRDLTLCKCQLEVCSDGSLNSYIGCQHKNQALTVQNRCLSAPEPEPSLGGFSSRARIGRPSL